MDGVAAAPLMLGDTGRGVEDLAAEVSSDSSSGLRISPMEQLMKTNEGAGLISTALPFPLGSIGGRGGGEGNLSAE